MVTGPEGTLPAGVRPLIPGDPPVVGHYPLLGRLGVGGMGVVYLGHHPDHGLVAVKIIRASHQDYPDHPNFGELHRRFRTEVDFARRVSSCCTARVIEDGTDASRPYIVTEYIQGPALHEVVERLGPLPAATVDAVALGVTAALVAIHRAGLVHRDLKPANLLLARTGPRVIDFGLASDIDIAGGPTQAGVVMGSPGWIAPERLAGEPATAASDIFSWGCLVAYAATGRHPFGDGGATELSEQVMHGRPDLTGISADLRGPVAAALSREPGLRPTAAGLLRTLLVPLLHGRTLAPGENVEGVAASMIAKIWRPPADLPDTDESGVEELLDGADTIQPADRSTGRQLLGTTAGVAVGWAGGATALALAVAYGLYSGGGAASLLPEPDPGVATSVRPSGTAGAPGPSGGRTGSAPKAPGSGAPSGARPSSGASAGTGSAAPGGGAGGAPAPGPTVTVSAPPTEEEDSTFVPPGQAKKSAKANPNSTKNKG